MNPLRRIASGLKTWPNPREWALTVVVFALYGLAAWGIGFATGLYQFTPIFDGLWRVALISFFLPSIGEEVFFRGLLIPRTNELASAKLQMGLALIAFLAWHPLNAWLFFPSVLPLFADPRFLVVTALLGVAGTYLWRKTGSLWPAILVHWVAVVIWKGFLGAPQVM